MIRIINIQGIAGFTLVAVLAVAEGWTLRDFCWSNWLAGLLYGWFCIVAAVVQIVLIEVFHIGSYPEKMAFFQTKSSPGRAVAMTMACLTTALVAYHFYSAFFLHLAVLISMLLNDNLFNPLNSSKLAGVDNAFDLVAYLLRDFWPIAAGMILTRWEDFVRGNPWKRIFVPLDKNLILTHILILGAIFCGLIAQTFFAENYQSITIVIVLGVMFFWPQSAQESVGKKAKHPKPDEPIIADTHSHESDSDTPEFNNQLNVGPVLKPVPAAGKISSDDTYIYKKVLPAVWAVVWTFLAIMMFVVQWDTAEWTYTIVVAAMVVSVLLYRNLLADLADEVIHEGDAFIIRKGKNTIRLELGTIRHAEHASESIPDRVTLHLAGKSELGERISFVPVHTGNPPRINELVARIITTINASAG